MKALNGLAPKSLTVTLVVVAGLLSVLPLIAWNYIEHSYRQTREAALLALQIQATAAARLLNDKAHSDGQRAPSRNAAVGGSSDSVASIACKPSSGAACPASAAAIALPPDPLALNPVGASLVIALPDPAPGSFLRTAALIYLGVVVISLLLLVGLLRRLNDFRAAVEGAVLSRSTMPAVVRHSAPRELAGVALSLERLVADLSYATGQLRTTAEDNAHALRTPIATVNTALFTLKRYLPAEPRALRAIKLIELSVDRMWLLVDAAQLHGRSVADLVDAPRQRIELATMVQAAIVGVSDDARERGISLRQRLDHPLIVLASPEALERAIRNVLLDAIEHSLPNGDISIDLSGEDGSTILSVEDAGPDDPEPGQLLKAKSVLTPDRAAAGPRAGLTDVQLAVESLGGRTDARRTARGGMKVTLTLPRDRT